MRRYPALALADPRPGIRRRCDSRAGKCRSGGGVRIWLADDLGAAAGRWRARCRPLRYTFLLPSPTVGRRPDRQRFGKMIFTERAVVPAPSGPEAERDVGPMRLLAVEGRSRDGAAPPWGAAIPAGPGAGPYGGRRVGPGAGLGRAGDVDEGCSSRRSPTSGWNSSCPPPRAGWPDITRASPSPSLARGQQRAGSRTPEHPIGKGAPAGGGRPDDGAAALAGAVRADAAAVWPFTTAEIPAAITIFS